MRFVVSSHYTVVHTAYKPKGTDGCFRSLEPRNKQIRAGNIVVHDAKIELQNGADTHIVRLYIIASTLKSSTYYCTVLNSIDSNMFLFSQEAHLRCNEQTTLKNCYPSKTIKNWHNAVNVSATIHMCILQYNMVVLHLNSLSRPYCTVLILR